MLTIRLARVGKKNKAQFQIVLQEHTVAPGGKHVEVLGSYDPHSKKEVLKAERIKYWVSQGAQVSDTAYNLFVSKGVLEGEKRKVKLPTKKVDPAAEAIADAGEPAKKVEKTKELPVAPVEAEVAVETKTEEPKREEVKTKESKAEAKVE